jgi:hypothetical protein
MKQRFLFFLFVALTLNAALAQVSTTRDPNRCWKADRTYLGRHRSLFLKNGKSLDEKEGPYRTFVRDEKRMALDKTGHNVEDGRRAVRRSVLLDHCLGGFSDNAAGSWLRLGVWSCWMLESA